MSGSIVIIFPSPIYNQSADYVISLSQYKIDIINLRHLTEVSLLALDEEDCALLTTRYIDNVSIEDAILVSGKARRTYFRAIARAMKNFEIIFYSRLCQSGIFDNPPRNSFWEDMFDKVHSFSEIYDVHLYPKNVCSMILRKLRRIAIL